MIRHRRRRPRLYLRGHLGCLGCSLPVLAVLGVVTGLNLHRRHLNESQRGMVGARIANLGQGRQESKPANLPVSQSAAADLLNVSDRLIRSARRVQESDEFKSPIGDLTQDDAAHLLNVSSRNDGSLVAFVVSLNLHRRHLNESQRAMVAAAITNLKKGQRADRVDGSIDLSTASEMLNVSRSSVQRARKVLVVMFL